jgi:sulfatase maturation enzyme AslB (radical SAM superfamily)
VGKRSNLTCAPQQDPTGSFDRRYNPARRSAYVDTPSLSIVVNAHDWSTRNTAVPATLHFNHRELVNRQLSHELLVVAWAVPPDRNHIAEALTGTSSRLPDWVRLILIDPAYRTPLFGAPNSASEDCIARNAGLRRAQGELVLITRLGILFGCEVLDAIASDALANDVVYTASRVDVPFSDEGCWPDWKTLDSARCHAAGRTQSSPADCLVLRRRQCEAVRGFNEVYRGGRIDYLSNFIARLQAEGYAVANLPGPVYSADARDSGSGTDAEALIDREDDLSSRVMYDNPSSWGLLSAPTQPVDEDTVYLPFSWSVIPRLVDLRGLRPAAGHEETQVRPNMRRELERAARRADSHRLEALLTGQSEAQVDRVFDGNRMMHNYVKNIWEFVQGRTVLTTYPWDVCIPIADVCNARCTFCSSWLEGTRMIELNEVQAFTEVLAYARSVGLAGHGEPLLHPQIVDILGILGDTLNRRSACYVITNGVFLEPLMDRLLDARVMRYAVSLNAASPRTHEEVMGLPRGSFARVVSSIRELTLRRNEHSGLRVSISLVVTQQNIGEIPAFIQLGHDLGVSRIQLKTLAPVSGRIEGLNYHLLPPYDHPDYRTLKANALDAIRDSRVEVQVDSDSWDATVFPTAVVSQPLPFVTRDQALRERELRAHWRSTPKYQQRTRGQLLRETDDFDGENPFGRSPRFSCRAPYSFLYINDFSYNVTPCCYMAGVPGHEPIIFDGSFPFFEAWNSPALVALRERLRDGPLFNMCTKCPATY